MKSNLFMKLIAADKGNAIITRRKGKQRFIYIGKAFTKDASKLGRKKGG